MTRNKIHKNTASHVANQTNGANIVDRLTSVVQHLGFDVARALVRSVETRTCSFSPPPTADDDRTI